MSVMPVIYQLGGRFIYNKSELDKEVTCKQYLQVQTDEIGGQYIEIQV